MTSIYSKSFLRIPQKSISYLSNIASIEYRKNNSSIFIKESLNFNSSLNDINLLGFNSNQFNFYSKKFGENSELNIQNNKEKKQINLSKMNKVINNKDSTKKFHSNQNKDFLKKESSSKNAISSKRNSTRGRGSLHPSFTKKQNDSSLKESRKRKILTVNNPNNSNNNNNTIDKPLGSFLNDQNTKSYIESDVEQNHSQIVSSKLDNSNYNEKNEKSSRKTGSSFYLKGPIPESQNGISPRISAYIAQLGIASRREAGEWVKNGFVTHKGKPMTDLSFRVNLNDKIYLKGYGNISPKIAMDTLRPRVWIARKPREVICSRVDEEGRTTLLEILQKQGFPNHISWVGRLDYMSEGLILLTNDGHLKRYLEDPKNKYKRTYLVRAHGHISEHQLQSIEKGSMVEGVKYGKMEIKIRRGENMNSDMTSTWLEMTLEEGKNREIRRVLEHLGLQVTRLIRIKFGPFELPRKMSIGQVKEVSIPSEMLRRTTYGNHDIPEQL